MIFLHIMIVIFAVIDADQHSASRVEEIGIGSATSCAVEYAGSPRGDACAVIGGPVTTMARPFSIRATGATGWTGAHKHLMVAFPSIHKGKCDEASRSRGQVRQLQR